MDWSIITPRISCGGKPDEAGVAGLLRYHHTHVLDLRHTTEDFDLYALNFTYLRLPAFDDGKAKPPDWFHRGVRFALNALEYPDHRLYVGCHSGVNRAPSMVAAILMAMDYSRDRAREVLHTERPGVELAYLEDACSALQPSL